MKTGTDVSGLMSLDRRMLVCRREKSENVKDALADLSSRDFRSTK